MNFAAVFEGAVESALSQLNSVYGDHIEVSCTPLRSYENFACEVLGLEKSLTAPSSRRLTSSMEGHLFWLTFKIGYSGLNATDLVNIWSKEATALLTLRNRGELELDLFKVVGQREVSWTTVFVVCVLEALMLWLGNRLDEIGATQS